MVDKTAVLTRQNFLELRECWQWTNKRSNYKSVAEEQTVWTKPRIRDDQ